MPGRETAGADRLLPSDGAGARMIKKLAGMLSTPLLQLHGAQDECTVAPTDATRAGSSTASRARHPSC